MSQTYQKPIDCEGCSLCKQPGPVAASGSPTDAAIIYVGQNPGRTEIYHNQPFVGASGNIRNWQLGQANIRLGQLFTTNVVKCLTPGNRPPTEGEVRYCMNNPATSALEEVKRAKAKVVILAGDIAMQAFLKDYSSLRPDYHPRNKQNKPVGIMARMGCVDQRYGKYFIPTLHPAMVMRVPEWRIAAVDHLKKARKLVNITIPDLKFNLDPTDNDIREACQHIITTTKCYSDDVETYQTLDIDEDDYIGGDWDVDIYGFSARPYEAIVCRPEQLELMEPVFADPNVWVFEHNGEYERYHIGRLVGEENLKNKRFDTMLGTHYLRNHCPKALKPFTLSQYTYLPYFDRGLGKVDRKFYNGMDVITGLLAAKDELREMQRDGLIAPYFRFGQPILPILEKWRRAGVNIDLPKALKFRRFIEWRLAKGEDAITKMLGPFFNWNSPLQIKDLLYNKWMLPKQWKDRKKTKLTTDFEACKRIKRYIQTQRNWQEDTRLKPAYLFLELLSFCNGEKKKLEYFERISGDGRIHAYYKAHGERPFRISSKPSLQNWPVYDITDWGGARRDKQTKAPVANSEIKSLGSLRSIVIPDKPEHWILTCDFEQLQLWIIAALFNVKWLLSIYEKNEYIYGVVYETLYKEPFFTPGKPKTKANKLKTIPEQRIRRAKAVPLGFLFGRTPESVAQEYGWDNSEGRALHTWWFNLNPELKKDYHDMAAHVLNQKDWFQHVFGQKMWFPAKKLTELINSFAQSNEAMIVLDSISQIDQQLVSRGLEAKGNRTMLSVHDSLSCNVTTQDAIEIHDEIIQPIMTRKIPELNGFQFRVSSDMTKEWDWNVIGFEEWRVEHG